MKLLVKGQQIEITPKVYQGYTVIFNEKVFGIPGKNICKGMIYNREFNRLEGKYVTDYPHVEDLYLYDGRNPNIEILAIFTDQEFLSKF